MPPLQCHEPPSLVLQTLSIRSKPLNLFVTYEANKECDTSSYVLLSQNCFGNSDLLWSQIKILESCSVKYAIGIFIALNL